MIGHVLIANIPRQAVRPFMDQNIVGDILRDGLAYSDLETRALLRVHQVTVSVYIRRHLRSHHVDWQRTATLIAEPRQNIFPFCLVELLSPSWPS